MTFTHILEQAKALSPRERKELAKLLIDTLETGGAESTGAAKTGEEIVPMLNAMPPVAFVDPEIDDPVEWVNSQRQKRKDALRPYRQGDQ